MHPRHSVHLHHHGFLPRLHGVVIALRSSLRCGSVETAVLGDLVVMLLLAAAGERIVDAVVVTALVKAIEEEGEDD
jgi:hypothetical protein